MPLTACPTSPHYPFVLAEFSGAGGSGKTHIIGSSIGMGSMAYFHGSERPGTIEGFAKWAGTLGHRLDWSNFGLRVDSRWKSDEVAAKAKDKKQEFFNDIAGALESSKYRTISVDNIYTLKALSLLSFWGPELPLTIPKTPGKLPFVDNMKVYGPVNADLNRLYDMFRNQKLRAGSDGSPIGTSLQVFPFFMRAAPPRTRARWRAGSPGRPARRTWPRISS